MAFNLTKFDMSEVSRSPACVAICGKRGSGKSVLIKDILYHLHVARVPRCVCFSATEDANQFFSGFVPDVFVHALNHDTLSNMWQAQKELAMQKAVGQLPPGTDTRLAIILDDCAFDKTVMKSAVLKEIFMNGRHHGVFFIVTLQYLIDLNVSMRSNVDVFFFLKELNLKNQERIYHESCGFLPCFGAFQDLFMASTSNYEAFVVNGRCKSSDAQQIIHYYKADPTLNFRFGPASIWRFHSTVYESATDRYVRMQREQQEPRAVVDSRPSNKGRRGARGGSTIVVRRHE
ncbi:hypothetical protein JKP88DRAFT_273035 [Tribonema minus]|uniref:Uncharacterized protein n=1 Tax=Tribonema minus TaxID=303371 RepID=A0A835Z4P3_9STRA|nr:hypothetical protein JKP88DRAFT_273035 [Tribonema minus]